MVVRNEKLLGFILERMLPFVKFACMSKLGQQTLLSE